MEADPQTGPAIMPSGRFVAGTTATGSGDVDVIGVCIPWAHAHVKTGQRNREPWQDHSTFLSALAEWLPASPSRMIVLGDFNQRVPRRFQPPEMFELLSRAILSRLHVATGGLLDGADRQAIDHICHSMDFSVVSAGAISNLQEDGRQISDHFGTQVQLCLD